MDDIRYTRVPHRGRQRRLRLRIKSDGSVVASAPSRVSDTALSAFVQEHRAWIEASLQKRAVRVARIQQLGTGTREEYVALKTEAYACACEHIERLNRVYGFSIGKITIRNQRSRWGSCSSRGGITFNYRIALLPYELAEYLVAHELCHVGELNHSEAFWKLVEKTVPDWKEKRARLHTYGLSQM